MRKNMKSGISMRKYMDFNKRNANLYNQVVLTRETTKNACFACRRIY